MSGDFDIETWGAEFLASLRADRVYRPLTVTAGITDAGIRALMEVREEYLTAAFDAIGERHGSVQRYADEILGIDDGRVGRLRERYNA